MARDYKRRATRRRKRTTPSPWLWTLAGLLIGLFVAFLVYLQLVPETADTVVTTPLEVPVEPPVVETVRSKPAAPPPPPPPAKPRFDFYDLLPEMEVIVPEQELPGEPTPEGVKTVEEPGTYLLQAGSFRSKEQAEQLRARLGLLGFETSIQTVSIDNRQSWHRVRVGPFRNLAGLNRARGQLKKNGVDAILIRLKK